jgi:hypothetical protein
MKPFLVEKSSINIKLFFFFSKKIAETKKACIFAPRK